MSIVVTCACGQSFAAKEHLAGKIVACPSCKQPLKIPLASQTAAPEEGFFDAGPADTGGGLDLGVDLGADTFGDLPTSTPSTSISRKSAPKPAWGRLIVAAVVGFVLAFGAALAIGLGMAAS